MIQKDIGGIVEFASGVFSTPIEEVVAREIIMEFLAQDAE